VIDTHGGHSLRTVSTDARAPRPARDWSDGRSPGSRVAARHRLPGL